MLSLLLTLFSLCLPASGTYTQLNGGFRGDRFHFADQTVSEHSLLVGSEGRLVAGSGLALVWAGSYGRTVHGKHGYLIDGELGLGRQFSCGDKNSLRIVPAVGTSYHRQVYRASTDRYRANWFSGWGGMAMELHIAGGGWASLSGKVHYALLDGKERRRLTDRELHFSDFRSGLGFEGTVQGGYTLCGCVDLLIGATARLWETSQSSRFSETIHWYSGTVFAGLRTSF